MTRTADGGKLTRHEAGEPVEEAESSIILTSWQGGVFSNSTLG